MFNQQSTKKFEQSITRPLPQQKHGVHWNTVPVHIAMADDLIQAKPLLRGQTTKGETRTKMGLTWHHSREMLLVDWGCCCPYKVYCEK